MQLSSVVDELVLGLTIAMDVDEGEKLYHCWRVAVMADALASRLPQANRAITFLAGLLHDIGGIGAPIHMVEYSRRQPDESPTIPEAFQHPYLGAQFIRSIPGLRARYRIADLVLQHHENWNGTGFPTGLSGDDIELEAMLLRAADGADVLQVASLQKEQLHQVLDTMRTRGRVKPSLVSLLGEVLQETEVLPLLQDEVELEKCVQKLYDQYRDELFSPVNEELLLEGMFVLAGKAIDNKHSYTQGHSVRVGHYALQIGVQMGLPEEDLLRLYYGAFVHDIGKLGVARIILDAPAKLNAEEWSKMKGHARLSWDILQLFPSLKPFSFAALHHERWDGSGYPFGMKGEEIPLLGRIMAVADSLDAMTSPRSYRPVWTFGRAIEEITKGSGSQYDPDPAKATKEAFTDLKEDLVDLEIMVARRAWLMRGIMADVN